MVLTIVLFSTLLKSNFLFIFLKKTIGQNQQQKKQQMKQPKLSQQNTAKIKATTSSATSSTPAVVAQIAHQKSIIPKENDDAFGKLATKLVSTHREYEQIQVKI